MGKPSLVVGNVILGLGAVAGLAQSITIGAVAGQHTVHGDQLSVTIVLEDDTPATNTESSFVSTSP